jgi:hypothetical protein
MDGSVAAAVLNPQELGIPISEEQVQSIMTEEYGKSYAKPVSLSNSQQVCPSSKIILWRLFSIFELPLEWYRRH